MVDLAGKAIPTALVGAGGIGKTSIALALLHHNQTKQWFGCYCRFIRCDQFTLLSAHFLRRLSNVISAGIENPENLTSLRTFLSSKKMLIVLDNAESILDPQGTDAQEIYTMVEELSQFDNIYIYITSCISTTSDHKYLDVPMLLMCTAHDTFYHIYGNDTDRVDSILGQLDFHPFSITLLATVARQDE